ncbi:hypothetical protein DSO57_1016233 [Entomophthora muscae]|uniref:Uncharacterized protein n=1 Tax=Entomophthora muscae TaxID=34485 RepID=A0ACC2RJP0_9FUNG|nr:hypothetical protein DSO57_1016233 [Entomophthora muscae]
MPRRKDAFVKDAHQALIDVFQDISEMLGDDPDIDIYMSGTTAAAAVVTPAKVVVANLGDCRIVIGQKLANSGDPQRSFRPLALTRDHTCSDSNERIRVEKAGARIAKNPADAELADAPLRIYKGTLPYPGLVMTRAFGDSSAHKVGLISEPEVSTHVLSEKDWFLVLGTDGVWDALNNSKVVHLISGITDADKASHQLAQKSLKYLDKKGIDDNTTNIVVLLRNSLCI